MKTQFDVTGMSCAACSARVQKAVETLEAATDVQVNLLTNSMTVEYDDTALTPNDIILKVKAAGYGAAVHDPKRAPPTPTTPQRQPNAAGWCCRWGCCCPSCTFRWGTWSARRCRRFSQGTTTRTSLRWCSWC